MAEYNVMVKMQLSDIGVEAQLAKIQAKIKPMSVPITVKATDVQKLETSLGKLKNQLESLKIKNQDAFKNPEVAKQYQDVSNLIGAYGKGTASLGQVQVAMGGLRNKFEEVNQAARTTITSTDNFGTAIAKVVGKIAMWGVATTALYGTLRKIKEGVQFIEDLNKSMTNVQIVTGMSTSQARALAIEYNNLAKELGATTLEVAEGSLEWQRQGKTAEETQKLLRASVMMAKLGNLDQAQSTEYLTSIINGYKLSLDEVMPTISKLVALDNNYASSVGEIAAALQKVSAVSSQSNVSLEEMAAMITVVSSDTRIAAETIGQAWKTVLMRLQNVKLGKFLSEDGEDISDVERVLTSLGVKVRDDRDSWRDFSDVLSDTMVLWRQLGSEGKTVEQSMIANAFAGQRQANVFIDLMNNQDKYNEALKVQAESLGLVEQRYKIFNDSVEAAKNRFAASLEEMWSKTITPEAIKNIADLGTKIIGVINTLGGLIPILKAIGAALIVINYQTILSGLGSLVTIIPAVISGLTGITFGLGGVTTALAATTAGTAAATAGISILVGALVLLISNIKTAEERVVALNEAFQEDSNQYNSNQEELKKLAERYEELSKKVNRSLEDTIELLDIQTTLDTKYGALTAGMDLYTDAIGGNSKAIETNIAWIKAQQGIESLRFLREQADKYSSARDYMEDQKKYGTYNLGKLGGMGTEKFTPEERLDYLGGQLAKGKENIGEFNYNEITREIEELSGAIEAANNVIISYEHNTNILKATSDESAVATKRLSGEQGDLVDALREVEEAQKAAAAAVPNPEAEIASMQSLLDTMDAVTAAQKEQTSAGYVSAQTAVELIRVNAELAKYLTQTANGYIFDAEAAKKATYQEMLNVFTKYNIASAAVAAANGNYKFAMSAIAAATATKDEKDEMVGLLNAFAAMSAPSIDKATVATKSLSNAQSTYNELLSVTVSMLKQQAQDQKNNLQDQLDSYKSIIDKQKELLDLKKKEDEYNDKVAEKNRELSDIENELLQLQFDNSEEGKKRRLELEAEKVEKTKELTDIQNDYSVETQKDALDKDYDNFKEGIDSKLNALDRYLQNAGELNAKAMELIKGRSASFYNSLLEWNRQYGSGIDSTIQKLWNMAGAQAAVASATGGGGANFDDAWAKKAWSAGDYINWDMMSHEQYPTEYSEGGMGVVPDGYPNDSYPMRAESGEMFMIFNKQQQRQLSKGVPISSSAFPSFTTSGNGDGGVRIGDIVISVAGSLDKSVLPELKETILTTVYKAMKLRGNQKNANAFSI